LGYQPVSRSTAADVPISQVAGCGEVNASAVLANACAEAAQGLSGMLGRPIAAVALPSLQNALFLRPAAASTSGQQGPRPMQDDAFAITNGTCGDKALECIIIDAASPAGVLYAVFRLLHWVRTEVGVQTQLPYRDAPAVGMRTWDLWDNQDGSVERGYAGTSVFEWSHLPSLLPRYTDYARLLASVGINCIVLNNVNACGNGNEQMLASQQIQNRAKLSALLASWGIQTLVSPCFASPIIVGGLKTADPLDAGVIAWWRTKAEEYKQVSSSFVGLLVKADSEGQPGPAKYGRTELQGANMLADALQPVGAVCVWRAFVHPPGNDAGHQPSYQYNLFHPWNGHFRSNVVVQVKNGPGDFQVREPVDALFGQMGSTNLGLELEATQEYLGQAKHLANLVPQWANYLRFDTMQNGSGTTLADIIHGNISHRQWTSMAAVSNFGNDPSWVGHPLSAVNAYGFGRLAWDPWQDASTITEEWIRATWGVDPRVVSPLLRMMMASWEVRESGFRPALDGVCY